MARFCNVCGINLDLTGNMHRCVPRAASVTNKLDAVTNKPSVTNTSVTNNGKAAGDVDRVLRWRSG